MRDIWYRRILLGVFVASAAVMTIWWRFRSRPTLQSNRTMPPIDIPASAVSPPLTTSPVAVPLITETSYFASITKQLSTPAGAIAWFSAAIVLCLAAAYTVSSAQSPNFVTLGPIFIGAAISLAFGALVAGAWLQRAPTHVWPLWPWRFIGLSAAVIVTFVAADVNFHTTEFDTSRQVASVFLWAVALMAAFAAAWQRAEVRTKSGGPTPRWEVFALIGVIAFAFALRVINLDHIPAIISGDETKYSTYAEYLTAHQVIKPFTTGSDGHWHLYFMITAIFIQLFGATVAAMRLPSVLAGTLSIVVTYVVVRQLWGRRPALIAAALLATYHHHLHFSRLGVNSIDDALFSMLVFGCLWLAWRTGQRRAWLMTALAAGLALYFFVGGRLVLFQAAAIAGFWLITERRRVRAQGLNIALAIGVFICIVMPNLYYAAVRPDDYLGSLNTKNIYRSGWVENEMQATGQSEGEILAQQVRRVLTVFSVGTDSAFYWAQAMLTPIMSVLAALALLYFIRRIREGPYFWLVSALTLLIVLGGILVVSPTAGSHRLLGSGPLIYVAIAVLIDRTLNRLEQWRLPSRGVVMIGAISVAALMIGDAHYYFVDYVGHHELQSPDVGMNAVQRYLMGIQARFDQGPLAIVCVGFNADYCHGTNLHYLAPRLLARAEVSADLATVASAPPPGAQPQIVIVNPLLGEEVQHAQRRYAAVEAQSHYGPLGKLEFVSFEVLLAK